MSEIISVAFVIKLNKDWLIFGACTCSGCQAPFPLPMEPGDKAMGSPCSYTHGDNRYYIDCARSEFPLDCSTFVFQLRGGVQAQSHPTNYQVNISCSLGELSHTYPYSFVWTYLSPPPPPPSSLRLSAP